MWGGGELGRIGAVIRPAGAPACIGARDSPGRSGGEYFSGGPGGLEARFAATPRGHRTLSRVRRRCLISHAKGDDHEQDIHLEQLASSAGQGMHPIT